MPAQRGGFHGLCGDGSRESSPFMCPACTRRGTGACRNGVRRNGRCPHVAQCVRVPALGTANRFGRKGEYLRDAALMTARFDYARPLAARAFVPLVHRRIREAWRLLLRAEGAPFQRFSLRNASSFAKRPRTHGFISARHELDAADHGHGEPLRELIMRRSQTLPLPRPVHETCVRAADSNAPSSALVCPTLCTAGSIGAGSRIQTSAAREMRLHAAM